MSRTKSKIREKKPAEYERPVYEILGKKYNLRPFQNYSVEELEEVDNFVTLSKIQNMQTEVRLSDKKIFSMVLRPIDNPELEPDINDKKIKFEDLIELTAKLAIDLILEKEFFFRSLKSMRENSAKRYAKLKGLM